MVSSQNAYVRRVVTLKEEIKQLKQAGNKELDEAQDELEHFGLIDKYAGVELYYDHVEYGGKKLKIDSGIQGVVQSGGNIYSTQNVHGGGSRPTITRIATGALIAGPLGAIIGSNFQKHKEITTDVEVHDARSLRIIIYSKDGYIDADGYPDDEGGAHYFVSQVMNAVNDYPKTKKKLNDSKEGIKNKISELKKRDELSLKQKELSVLMDNASDDDKKALKHSESLSDGALALTIISLFIWHVPILGLLLPVFSIYICVRAIRAGGSGAGCLILSSFALILSVKTAFG